MKTITYQPAARQALKRMPRPTALRIVDKVEAYARDPGSQANNVTALKGREGIRLRVGDWRVIMLDGEVLDVLRIASRGSVCDQENRMNEMVTIPRAEYDRLREAAEDLEDILAFDAAMKERGEGVPDWAVRRILEDEHPVRVFRDWRGLSAAELGRRSGVHPVQVHEIETGKKRGSVDTLKRLAEALGVRLDDVA